MDEFKTNSPPEDKLLEEAKSKSFGGGAEIGFTPDGKMVVRNRKYRRQRVKLENANQFTKPKKKKRKKTPKKYGISK